MSSASVMEDQDSRLPSVVCTSVGGCGPGTACLLNSRQFSFSSHATQLEQWCSLANQREHDQESATAWVI